MSDRLPNLTPPPPRREYERRIRVALEQARGREEAYAVAVEAIENTYTWDELSDVQTLLREHLASARGVVQELST